MGTAPGFMDERDEPPQKRQLGATSQPHDPTTLPGHLPDPLIDTAPAGLHTFDLGTVPASVTPPRTWRRAAWFTIAASAAALIALVSVTSLLVSPAQVTNRINALPSLPDGTAPSFEPTHPPSGGPAVASPVARASAAVNPPDGLAGPVDGPADVDPPTLRTVPGNGPTAVNPNKLADLTSAFFADVTSDVTAAASLVVNAVRDHMMAIVARKYGDVSSIQVKSISLDPRTGVTVSSLQLIHQDGTVSSVQQTLHFTLGDNPKIEQVDN